MAIWWGFEGKGGLKMPNSKDAIAKRVQRVIKHRDHLEI